MRDRCSLGTLLDYVATAHTLNLRPGSLYHDEPGADKYFIPYEVASDPHWVVHRAR